MSFRPYPSGRLDQNVRTPGTRALISLLLVRLAFRRLLGLRILGRTPLTLGRLLGLHGLGLL